jgi:hypothetical protein
MVMDEIEAGNIIHKEKLLSPGLRQLLNYFLAVNLQRIRQA